MNITEKTQKVRKVAFDALAQIHQITIAALQSKNVDELAVVSNLCRQVRQSIYLLHTTTEGVEVDPMLGELAHDSSEQVSKIEHLVGSKKPRKPIKEMFLDPRASVLLRYDDTKSRLMPFDLSWISKLDVNELSSRDMALLPEGYYGVSANSEVCPGYAILRLEKSVVRWDFDFTDESISVYHLGISNQTDEHNWLSISEMTEPVLIQIWNELINRVPRRD